MIRIAAQPDDALRATLARYEIAWPDRFAVAVFDHGDAPTSSNRRFRFAHLARTHCITEDRLIRTFGEACRRIGMAGRKWVRYDVVGVRFGPIWSAIPHVDDHPEPNHQKCG